MRRWMIITVAGLWIGGLAGCGGSSNHASAVARSAELKAARDPCGVLSSDDVYSALRAPITTSTPLARASCTYMLPSVSKQPGEVDVVVAAGQRGRDDWHVDLQDPVEPVPGAGDQAWAITNSQYHKIGVRSGDLYVFVTVVQDDPDLPPTSTLVSLAQDVMHHVG